MSWLYIPKEIGAEIEAICEVHFNLETQCKGCPLRNSCDYNNDPLKTDAENTRIFEHGLSSALTKYKE